MIDEPVSRNKKFKKTEFFFILVPLLILVLLLSEILYRTYHKIVYHIPFSQSVRMFYDKNLGWKGRMVFGDATAKKYKIFFVGDSFTYGGQVQESDRYYHIVGKNLDAEAFAYGGSGYGTLQEYLVIDKYLDQIRPDLIILQVCFNDFINNSWRLESASCRNNNLMVRPYLIDEKIKYYFPSFLGKLRLLLSSYSRLFYFQCVRIDRIRMTLAKKKILHSVEEDIEKNGLRFDDFNNAVMITNSIVARIKNRIGDTPLVVFAVDDNQPYQEQFRSIFKEKNVEFIESVPFRIKQENAKGKETYLKDGTHWNSLGQKICGEVLVQELSKRGYKTRKE